MRSIEAGGVRVQLKAHALSAAMRKAIEIVEQFREAAEAGEDFVQRAGAAPLWERQARRVDGDAGAGHHAGERRASCDQLLLGHVPYLP